VLCRAGGEEISLQKQIEGNVRLQVHVVCKTFLPFPPKSQQCMTLKSNTALSAPVDTTPLESGYNHTVHTKPHTQKRESLIYTGYTSFIPPLSTRTEERALSFRPENGGPWCWKWVLGPWAFEDTYLIICVV
jgi:hypothetical protein